MVYRLVYKDSAGALWIQYGADNINFRPQFLKAEHCLADNLTIHPSVESAMCGMQRFNEFDSSADVKIQFANDRHSEWTYIVDEDAFLGHIDKMIMC